MTEVELSSGAGKWSSGKTLQWLARYAPNSDFFRGPGSRREWDSRKMGSGVYKEDDLLCFESKHKPGLLSV
jgi:hypothetical protein